MCLVKLSMLRIFAKFVRQSIHATMTLNESKGNMYEFITHTWNPIKGKCFHGCTYCYMHGKWGQSYQYWDITKLSGTFKSGQFIFIGSSTDFCSEKVKSEWIKQVLDFCYQNNPLDIFGERAKFLLQTKNPERLLDFVNHPLLNQEHGIRPKSFFCDPGRRPPL